MSTEDKGESQEDGLVPPEVTQRLFEAPGDPDHKLFYDELNKQTPRGVAVLGVSFLEWRVREAIRSQLKVQDKKADSLLGTADKTGDLDYSEQCKLAYCLGLVGEYGYADLGTVGTIRNKFAHRVLVRDFNHQHIVDLLKNLETLKRAPRVSDTGLPQSMEDDPRGKFVVTIHFLGLLLSSTAHFYLSPPNPGRTKSARPEFFW